LQWVVFNVAIDDFFGCCNGFIGLLQQPFS
jgi:hypothetical protein